MLWKSEFVLFDGDAYFKSLFEDWARATTSIDFETYIFDSDPIGDEVMAELRKAHDRGVKVRLLVDGIGSSGWWQTKGVELEKYGLAVRVYHPVAAAEIWRRLLIDLNLIEPDRKPRKSLLLRRLNRRNHRKVSIVDGSIAHVGSVNVSQFHCARLFGPTAWRDTSVRLEGPAIADLSFAYDHAWRRSQAVSSTQPLKIRFFFRRRSNPAESPVGLNFSRRMRRFHRLKFVRKIETARERIWISNAYLAPPSNIVRRLAVAAQRGVDVRILVPSRSTPWFMSFIARAYYRALLKGGVHVYEFLPRFLHAKSMIIDNQAIIGTSNLNRRSFLHDFEVDVTVSDPQTIDTLANKYLDDLKEAIEAHDRGTILGSRLGWLLNYLFRYWV